MITRDDIMMSNLGREDFEILKYGEEDIYEEYRRQDNINNVIWGLSNGQAFLDYSRNCAIIPVEMTPEEQAQYGDDYLKLYDGDIFDYDNEGGWDYAPDEKIYFIIDDPDPDKIQIMSKQEAYDKYYEICNEAAHGYRPEYSVPVKASILSTNVMLDVYQSQTAGLDALVGKHTAIFPTQSMAERAAASLEHMAWRSDGFVDYDGSRSGSFVGVKPTLEALKDGQYQVSVDPQEFESAFKSLTPEEMADFKKSYEMYQVGMNFSLKPSSAKHEEEVIRTMGFDGTSKPDFTYAYLLDEAHRTEFSQYGFTNNPYEVMSKADFSGFSNAEIAEAKGFEAIDDIEGAKRVAERITGNTKEFACGIATSKDIPREAVNQQLLEEYGDPFYDMTDYDY